MSSYKDMYGSSFLKAADLRGKPRRFTATDVTPEKLRGEDRPKLVVDFKETDKRLVLNATNAATFETIFGSDDYEQWLGRVELYPDVTDFSGQRVDCIRCRAAKKAKPAPKQEPDEDEDEDLSDFDDD